MATMSHAELLAYMRTHKLTVVATVNRSGAPEAALVGIAITDSFELIFDTVSASRKHANLVFDPRIAVTFCGPGEQTLQYEGLAFPISTTGPADRPYREAYYGTWPDGRSRLDWDGLVYWGVKPVWARYSDFDRGPLIAEFRWGNG
ncbi:MAG: pyridoxamine 5'-phosphate oxidase family protein [Rhizomicrobium sp.]